MNRLKAKHGFTLLEVLISITILALMALMISRIFSESTRAVERGKDQALTDETARLLLDYMEQDISQAIIRTNVAFRVHTVDANDALYFISTAVRRQLANIRRDTAPIRWQAPISRKGREAVLNQTASVLSPDNSAGNKTSNLANLIQQSDYYYSTAHHTVEDFHLLHDPQNEMELQEGFYTQPLDSGQNSHAVVTFLDIVVNASPANSRDSSMDIHDMPRFVDVFIGLIASADMERAIDLQNAGNPERAESYIDQYETLYSRRIYLRNRGVDQLSL